MAFNPFVKSKVKLPPRETCKMTGTEWLDIGKKEGNVLYCALRDTTLHKRHCVLELANAKINFDDPDPEYSRFERPRSVCNECSIYKNKMDVTRALKRIK